MFNFEGLNIILQAKLMSQVPEPLKLENFDHEFTLIFQSVGKYD